jgi:hypothetical protein
MVGEALMLHQHTIAKSEGHKMHIVLLGDSIFDNKIYVEPSEKSVSEHLQDLIADSVTLLAVDGNVTNDVASQLERMPDSATHLFVSVGGNDALAALSFLGEPVSTVYQGLGVLAMIRITFLNQYRRMLGKVLDLGLPVTVCTIYNCVPNLPESDKTALALFNEVITSEAFRLGLSVIDLRHVCNEPSDYAEISPIEPSHTGGLKIAQAIRSRI